MAWLDTRTHEGLLEVSNFIETVQKRQGLHITCLRKSLILRDTLQQKSYWKQLRNLKRPITANTYLNLQRMIDNGKIQIHKNRHQRHVCGGTYPFEDQRGYFMETYQENDFRDAGYDLKFVQDNQSQPTKGVLRGLNLQVNYPQRKLVRVIRGEVFDVGVDLRGDSKTYGEWSGEKLSKDNKKQLYIPPRFTHEFLVLSDEAEFTYKCTEFYHGEDESGIIWNDSEIGIDWPLDGIYAKILSDKDRKWMIFKNSKIRYWIYTQVV